MSTIYQIRYANLRELIERHGGPSAFAIKVNRSRQFVSNISSERPSKNIGSKVARDMEAALGLPIGAIDTPAGTPVGSVTEPSSDTVEVPVLDITASAGPGASVPWEEEVIHKMLVSKRWLRSNTQATAFNRLAIITAKGDSMEPTFCDGATLLVDTTITAMKSDAVYIITRNADLFIKRIQRNMDGTFDVISDNKAYEKQVIKDPYKEGFLVMGKVLTSWNPHKM